MRQQDTSKRSRALEAVARRFGSLRRKPLEADERATFFELFGRLGEDEQEPWPAVVALRDMVDSVCAEQRHATLGDLVRAARQHIPDRSRMAATCDLESKVMAYLRDLHASSNVLARLDNVWFIWQRPENREMTIRAMGDNWWIRIHDPHENEYEPWGIIRACSLREACLESRNAPFWRSLLSGNEPPILVVVPPEDPWGVGRAKARAARLPLK